MRMTERLRALRRSRAQRSEGRPPPCVGCHGGSDDQLESVEAGLVSPSTPASIVGPVPGTQAAVVDDHLVMLDPATGRRVLLNSTAALIATAFDRERTVADAIAQLGHETGLATEDIADDVLATVDRLVSQGLLARADLAEDGLTDERPATGSVRVERVVPTEDGHGARVWMFDSGPWLAAGVGVTVRVEPEELAGDVRAALPPFTGDPARPGGHRIDLVVGERETAQGGTTIDIVVDGVVRDRGVRTGAVVARLFDRLDALLAEQTAGLRFHAGAVERDGEVVVVAGRSGQGKSTLTAALVQAGWRYLTDELVVVDPDSLQVTPYLRPLDLDAASLAALGIAEPDISTGLRKDKVVPSRLGATSTGGRIAAVVVLTDHAPEGDPVAESLPAPEAVMAMVTLTFASTFADPDALVDLAHLCSTARTVRLHRAPLDDLVRAVDELVAAPTGGAPER